MLKLLATGLLACLFSGQVIAQETFLKIKPIKTYWVKGMSEASEIVTRSSGDGVYILANKAFLYKANWKAEREDKIDLQGYDIEGATLVGDRMYISDESLRQILVYNVKTALLEKTHQLQYGGGANMGFEAIVYLPNQTQFLLCTEKSPCVFHVYNQDFQLLNQFRIKGIREVSAMCWHKNRLYVLSDEEAAVYCVDYEQKKILKEWRLPIVNPEGICFDESGNLFLISDDMGKLFEFSKADIE